VSSSGNASVILSRRFFVERSTRKTVPEVSQWVDEAGQAPRHLLIVRITIIRLHECTRASEEFIDLSKGTRFNHETHVKTAEAAVPHKKRLCRS
jgi:hypothetical protein